jgi:peptide/nickel transport system permease protein
MLPLLIVAVFAVCAIFAPFLAPHSPIKGELAKRYLPPLGIEGADPSYLLGTDTQGRDILSRVIYGARITLFVSVMGILLTSTLGTLVGLLAGFLGGWVDIVAMRLVDVGLSIPGMLIAVLLASVFGASTTNVILVIIVVLWPDYARLVRGETLALKQQDYVALARVAGCSNLTIMFRHILPNLMATVLVLVSLHAGLVIVLEASLSFLGVGVPPPNSSWGFLISEGRGVLERAWWVSIVPGLAIVLTVISLNMLGDWMRDRLDPKLRQL